MNKPLAVLAAAVLLAVAFAGCTPSPPSPVAAIPKIIVDYQDNTTRLYLTSVNADVFYANLSINLHNDNFTENETFVLTKAYAVVASTEWTYFALNASAVEANTHYWYNATVHIADRTPNDLTDAPVWQAYIRDSPDGTPRAEGLPYHGVLSSS